MLFTVIYTFISISVATYSYHFTWNSTNHGFDRFFFLSFWLKCIKMKDKHSQDRLGSTQQTNSYKQPWILFASQQSIISYWDWACGGATVNWTATDLSAGCVTTHYAALKNPEASFWHTDSQPETHTWLIFHLMFTWMTISRFMTSDFIAIQLLCSLFLPMKSFFTFLLKAFYLFSHHTGNL